MNDFKPHVIVLCEDDANRKIAMGFVKEEPSLDQRALQIPPPAGGWRSVLEKFEDTYIPSMSRYPHRHIVLMIDFDTDDDRLETIKKSIPHHLINRVIVLGARPDPEALRTAGLGTFEEIGQKLVRDCVDNTTLTWDHRLLDHNAGELQRMALILRPILFP